MSMPAGYGKDRLYFDIVEIGHKIGFEPDPSKMKKSPQSWPRGCVVTIW